MLSRYSTNLSFCFDTDQAGQAATRRGIGLALSQNFVVKMITLGDDECKDPADYVKKYGEKFNEIVASAKPALQYYYDTAITTYDPASAESKKSIVAVLGPLIKRLASKVEQSHWIGQLAVLLRASQNDIKADLSSVRDDIAAYERDSDQVSEPKIQAIAKPVDALSQEVLALAMKDPELLTQIREISPELLDPRVATVVSDPALLDPGIDHEYRHMVDVAYMRAAEVWQTWSPQDLKAELATVIGRLKERDLRRKIGELSLAVQEAEARHDKQQVADLLEQFSLCTQELNRLQNTPISTS
jgi:DNA primase